MVVEIVDERQDVNVPGWVTDIETFRQWTDADDFPENVRIWWLQGKVWIDMSQEQVFTHVLVKTRISTVLDLLALQDQFGVYLTDGVLLSNFAADISGNPDGLFLRTDTLGSDRIRLIESKRDGGCIELQGSPDMVLEIVSKSSVKKDNVILKQAYYQAGVREYWVVDIRKEPVVFDVFRHTARGYVRTPKQDGWVKSAVFGKAFRLVVQPGSLQGHPDCRLEVR